MSLLFVCMLNVSGKQRISTQLREAVDWLDWSRDCRLAPADYARLDCSAHKTPLLQSYHVSVLKLVPHQVTSWKVSRSFLARLENIDDVTSRSGDDATEEPTSTWYVTSQRIKRAMAPRKKEEKSANKAAEKKRKTKNKDEDADKG
ncbi:uncharacterized protein LOC144743453 [Ciona intestinalis]